MARADKQGRPYLKRKDLRPGMQVELDDDFTCMFAGKHTVEKDEGGHFLRCTGAHSRGPKRSANPKCQHYLEPQADGNRGYLIGVYAA